MLRLSPLRLASTVAIGVAVLAVAGCGGSSGPATPTIQKARQFRIVDVRPAGLITPGHPTTLSFRILMPSGTTMTRFRTGSGPHTGVHLIIVRDDLSVIIHRHPPVGPGGRFSQPVTFPSPGPYKLLLDVYPAETTTQSGFQQSNFQLTTTLRVGGAYHAQPLPATTRAETVDGYRFRIEGHPSLRAIEPAFLKIAVTDPNGKPAVFQPWYGALAHAIFFQKGTLAYFHTHVCSPGAGGCASVLGSKKVTGSTITPGVLTVGILLPLPGTWRMFVQIQSNGQIVTAPFTLVVG